MSNPEEKAICGLIHRSHRLLARLDRVDEATSERARRDLVEAMADMLDEFGLSDVARAARASLGGFDCG